MTRKGQAKILRCGNCVHWEPLLTRTFGVEGLCHQGSDMPMRLHKSPCVFRSVSAIDGECGAKKSSWAETEASPCVTENENDT